MSNPIRVGVVGFGLAGRIFHTMVIDAVPGLELATIVQRKGDEAAEAYPKAKIARSVEELLADETIRLVVLATPSGTHFELAQQCLNAGRNVVIDKPFTVTSCEAATLIKLARDKKVLLAVYHNRRWDGDFLTVRQILKAGTLGRLITCESRIDRWRAAPRLHVWRESLGPGSGLLLDIGPHLIDQALQLFGVPQSIAASIRIERDNAVVEDAFDIRLSYPRLEVVLGTTLSTYSPAPRFTLHGTGGSFRKWGIDPQEGDARNGMTYADPAWGREPEEDWGSLHLVGESPRRIPTEIGDYRGYYAHIRDAVNGLVPLTVTGEDAWKVARVIELARESSEQRCTLDVDLSKMP